MYLTFDFDLGVQVTQTVAQHPLHHVTCAIVKFEIATPNGLGRDALQKNLTFDLGVNDTQNVAKYPLQYVTYAPVKFEIATSYG